MMPVIFIGHGSPMNAIEDNEYTKVWKEIAVSLPKPDAILAISAHWTTKGTKVSTLEKPQTIHDFYGFPKELFEVEYKAEGARTLALETVDLLEGALEDESWGIDHGTWSVLNVMYPEADIPVYQLSIDEQATPMELFEIGEKLKPLREKNVLIMGSGNIVHNLRVLDYSKNTGFDWAIEFDDFIQEKINEKDYEGICNYEKLGSIARLSVPTTEHFYPLLYMLGLVNSTDKVKVFNKAYMAGGLSMTAYVWEEI